MRKYRESKKEKGIYLLLLVFYSYLAELQCVRCCQWFLDGYYAWKHKKLHQKMVGCDVVWPVVTYLTPTTVPVLEQEKNMGFVRK